MTGRNSAEPPLTAVPRLSSKRTGGALWPDMAAARQAHQPAEPRGESGGLPAPPAPDYAGVTPSSVTNDDGRRTM
jgi:hypothetical protein